MSTTTTGGPVTSGSPRPPGDRPLAGRGDRGTVPRRIRATAALVAGVGLLGLSPAAAASTPARVALPDPVPEWPAIAGATDTGPAPSGLVLHVRVYLAGRSPAGAVHFATVVSDPTSAAYGQYLTPAQWSAAFGPAPGQVHAVEAWATAEGLHVTSRTAHYLAVTGSAPALGAALATSIHGYSSASGLSGYAPVEGMSVPGDLAGDVSTVVGLDAYSFPASSSRATTTARAPAAPPVCSTWWGQHESAIPPAGGVTRAPDAVCGYTPGQLRSAYGVTAGSGRGSTIAIVLDGHVAGRTMELDADRFFADHGLPGFAAGQFEDDLPAGLAASCGGSADVPEEPLDVETAHIIAPAAKVVYVAADCGATATASQEGFLDAETRVVDDHLGDVETDSFSTTESAYTEAMAAAYTQVFEQGAAEGIGFDFDSGDDGDGTGGAGGTPSVQFPASDPWATAVGGAATEIGRAGSITAQLGWGDTGDGEDGAGTGYLQALPGTFEQGSTGGPSRLFAEPAYQRTTVPGGLARGRREVPDVAADADPMTGWLIGFGFGAGGAFAERLEGGTSGASPIVAALEADADALRGDPLGFVNPLLYRLGTAAGVDDVVAPPHPALAAAPNCDNDATQTGPVCVTTLGLDGGLREAVGFDDVTGLGAVDDEFAARLGAS